MVPLLFKQFHWQQRLPKSFYLIMYANLTTLPLHPMQASTRQSAKTVTTTLLVATGTTLLLWWKQQPQEHVDKEQALKMHESLIDLYPETVCNDTVKELENSPDPILKEQRSFLNAITQYLFCGKSGKSWQECLEQFSCILKQQVVQGELNVAALRYELMQHPMHVQDAALLTLSKNVFPIHNQRKKLIEESIEPLALPLKQIVLQYANNEVELPTALTICESHSHS